MSGEAKALSLGYKKHALQRYREFHQRREKVFKHTDAGLLL